MTNKKINIIKIITCVSYALATVLLILILSDVVVQHFIKIIFFGLCFVGGILRSYLGKNNIIPYYRKVETVITIVLVVIILVSMIGVSLLFGGLI